MTDTNNNWIQTIIESIRPKGLTDEEWNQRALFGWQGGKIKRYIFTEEVQIFEGKCVITGKSHTIRRIPCQAFEDWLDGALIQDALSMVSEEDRGFLLDGMTDEGRKQLFVGIQ